MRSLRTQQHRRDADTTPGQHRSGPQDIATVVAGTDQQANPTACDVPCSSGKFGRDDTRKTIGSTVHGHSGRNFSEENRLGATNLIDGKEGAHGASDATAIGPKLCRMMRHRIAGSIVTIAALLILATGCGNGSGETAVPTMTLPMPSPSKIISSEKVNGSVKIVTIRDHKFSPETVTIHPGEAVKWVFEDKDPHTVTGLRDKGMIINSPVLRQGSEYQIVFHTVEELDYICAIHPDMKGKVIIEPK